MVGIQVDMFEVQLGAGLLLQFRTPSDRVVRILADAGMKGPYPKDHVHRKLTEAFATFGETERRIDLIVGTHYDADHLEGLVPIIEDESIEIAEAWMPPVANDTEAHAAEEEPGERHFLAVQFAEDAGDGVRRYLAAKRQACEQLQPIEHAADPLRGREIARFRETVTAAAERAEAFGDDDPLASELAYFRTQHDDAEATLGTRGTDHADEDMGPAPELPASGLIERERSLAAELQGDPATAATARWRNDLGGAEAQARSVAYIRKSAAKDAINAISLAKVVRALRDRDIPISCQTIPDGKPRRFIWDDAEQRFVPSAQKTTKGPEFLLLGPSKGLVKKHWDRLPLGDYMTAAFTERLPVKSLTPSNQLSYVMRVEFGRQGLLVCGDAGCVDFKPGPSAEFFPSLLKALLPLHVIQVAHHAGNNAEFYNVLIEAGYGAQKAKSWLLLSHATKDKYRPSDVFGSFIGAVRADGDDMALLFTSTPQAKKVRQFTEIVHPVVGTADEVGDVRLAFNGRSWRVLKHAVEL